MNELRRKLIHMSSAAVPLFVWFAPRSTSLLVIGVIVVVALIVEVARREVRWFRARFLKATRRMLRPRERHRVTGASYMAISYFLTTLLFPRPIAVVAMLYNAFGDAVAAIVGRAWGRHRVGWGKSYEGSAASFLVSAGVGFLVPGVSTLAAIVGAAGATLLEFLPLPVDDNIALALGGGAILWIAGAG